MPKLDKENRRCQRAGCRRKSEWLVLSGQGETTGKRLAPGGLCSPCTRRLAKETLVLRDGTTVRGVFEPTKHGPAPFAMIRAVPVQARG
jgi:hypothetical protein